MVSWVNNQGNSENYCSVSGFLLWKTEEMGNVLILLQQSFPSISPGILNLLSSAGFWNTPYTKSTAKAKLPLAQLIPVAEEVTAGAQRQKIPQSLLEASVDPIKGHSLFSTGDQPPTSGRVQAKFLAEKKFVSISEGLKLFHSVSLLPFVQNNFPVLISSKINLSE